ncbi:tail fiber protein [Providencia phage vB_PreS-PatoteraRojo]|nr:tail fiber protein [Providencia phage vB_PreS-PatoteraRojo]
MPKKVGPNQGLPYGWIRGEDYWGGPMSDSQVFLDTMLFPVIKSLTFSSPPTQAVEGATYSIAANPTGAWSGHAGEVAVYVENAWQFYPPKKGWRAYVESFDKMMWYNGTTWVNESDGQDPVNPDPDPSIKPKWYDIAVTVSDSMYENEPILHLPITDPMVLQANMLGSIFDMADAASEVYYQFRVQRNGQNIATMTIEQGAFNATFTTSGGNPVAFGAGDRLTVRAQAERVVSMKNFGFVIRMGLS